MNRISRRDLARSITDRIIAGEAARTVMRQAAAYLVEHKRASQMDALLADIAVELQARTGHAAADVRVAHELTAENRRALERLVKDKLNAESVELAVETDTSLLGGTVIRTAEYEYDGSARNKLNQLARGKR